MSDKHASLREKIAGKSLIGFDTTSWAGPEKLEMDASVTTKVGVKPGRASVAAKLGLKPEVRASVAARVGAKPI